MRKLAFVLSIAWIGCTTGGDDDALTDAGAPPDATTRDAGLADGDVLPETCTEESRDSTLGMACELDPDCDDGCFCNGLEACIGEVCVASTDPCVDEVDCTMGVCLEDMNRCMTTLDHAMCQDGDACNGDEVCSTTIGPGTGCAPGIEPECNDETTCTYDSCDTALGCVYTPRDLDMDGFIAGSCGGEDCDDDPRFGVDIYPGAIEDCFNRRDDNCDGLRDYSDESCIPTNDVCSSAVVLPGPGTYSGATRGLRGDFTLSCGPGSGGGGPDAVFRFHLDEPQDVRVNLAGGGFDATVALRRFDQCSSGPDEKCQWGSGPTFLRRSLPAGDYAIIVKTTSETVFDVVLRFGPPTSIPPVDLCNSMTTDVSGGGSFEGFFEEVEDDYSLSCAFGSSRDVAHRLVLTEAADVQIDVTTSASFSQTFVSLVTDCGDPSTTLRCTQNFGPTSMRFRGLPAGTYYILLESGDTTATMWTMSVSVTSPPAPRAPGDACTSAIDITTAAGTVDMATLENDGGNSCMADAFAVDANFYFDVPAGGADVTLSTTSTEPFGTWVGSSVGTTCGSSATELTCRTASTPVTQRWLSLAEGRYYVTTATFSMFGSLTVSAAITTPPTPIPPNDRCTGAIALTSGVVSRGTLLGFGDDAAGCGFGGQPDAFYSFTLSRRSNVTLVASPGAGFTGDAWLTIKSSCAAFGSLACGNGRPAAISQDFEPGTYIVMVESNDDFSAGDFTITPIITPL
jgi:hypothetical protein